ncbi:MAG: sulfatase [Thermoguttaceae bacterium]
MLLSSKIVKYLTKIRDQREQTMSARAVARFGWRPCRPIGLMLLPLVSLLLPNLSVAAAVDKPNVLLILADDLGWSDTTLYGTTRFYQTPNVERLAARGMLFTRAYSASPLCSPTRASILSGQTPARTGITSPTCHLEQVLMKPSVARTAPSTSKALGCESATRFDTSYYTLAEALKAAGYATGHFGKWHLGREPYDPLHQGFDVDVPHWPGPGPAGSYVAPWKFPDFKERSPHEHIEDRMGDEAVAFIEQNKDKPFYLNYWQFSVHAPFDAKPELIEKHRKRVDPNDPQRSPTYAAMVESFDDAIGKLLGTLDRLQLADRTIVIFYADNGGNMYNEIDGTTPTSNVPLRGGKATMYEGGIRVPCVVAWPGVVRAGSRCDVPIQSTDLYPTLLAGLGLSPQPDQVFDGISILPALGGRADQMPTDRAIFTFFPHGPKVPDNLPPAVAVHQGDWKLIRVFYEGEGGKHAYQLYNLRDDLGETNDLAAAQPDRVQKLDALIEDFLKRTGAVVPSPNPNYSNTPGLAALRDCTIKLQEGRLLVTCTGGDPHFECLPAKPLPAGPLTVELRMKSTAKGPGQLYWHQKGVRPEYFRDRSTRFEVEHDGQFHTYQVQLPNEGEAVSLRLDPAQGPGEIVIETLRVTGPDGQSLADWLTPPLVR